MNIHLRIANYISRYAPSRQKIEAYLSKKDYPEIERLLTDIGYDESLMINMWMRTYISLGTGRWEIERKLQKKGFPKNLITDTVSASLSDIESWDIQASSLLRQINTLRSRGKSMRMIHYILIEKYPYFRDEITDTLSSLDDHDPLEKELMKYLYRYSSTLQKDREKIYAALMRKGFTYADIRNHMEKIQQSDA